MNKLLANLTYRRVIRSYDNLDSFGPSAKASVRLSQHQMRKFSTTAGLEADSEIVVKEDDRDLRLEPPARFTSRAHGRFRGEAPIL